jgi:hypothetical protein
MPPASHVNHHAASAAIPADATCQHIHSEQGMADVIIEPGRVGTADVTIHLLNEDLTTLAASELTLTLTVPTPGSNPTTHPAARDRAPALLNEANVPQKRNATDPRTTCCSAAQSFTRALFDSPAASIGHIFENGEHPGGTW